MKNPFVRQKSEVDRLRKSLREHVSQMRRILSAPDRDSTNAHIFLAGHLRTLLCDSYPIMLNYANLVRHDLRIWGPKPNEVELGTNVVMSVHFLIASSKGNPLMHEMSIEEYLRTPIGVANWQKYTPFEIIKLVANKEGAAHLDPRQSEKLEDIRSAFSVSASITGQPEHDNDVIPRMTILQISEWALSSIQYLLTLTSDTGKDPGAS